MNTKNKQLVSIILFVVGFILFDLALQKNEIIIQPPIIIRKKEIVSPMTPEQVQKMIEESIKEVPAEVTKKASKVVLAKSGTYDTNDDLKRFYSYVLKYSDEYNVSEKVMSCILMNESTFRADPCGVTGSCDGGLAAGIAQWHLTSWQDVRRKMGLSTKDLRSDPEESIKTMAFAISIGEAWRWTPWNDGRCR